MCAENINYINRPKIDRDFRGKRRVKTLSEIRRDDIYRFGKKMNIGPGLLSQKIKIQVPDPKRPGKTITVIKDFSKVISDIPTQIAAISKVANARYLEQSTELQNLQTQFANLINQKGKIKEAIESGLVEKVARLLGVPDDWSDIYRYQYLKREDLESEILDDVLLYITKKASDANINHDQIVLLERDQSPIPLSAIRFMPNEFYINMETLRVGTPEDLGFENKEELELFDGRTEETTTQITEEELSEPPEELEEFEEIVEIPKKRKKKVKFTEEKDIKKVQKIVEENVSFADTFLDGEKFAKDKDDLYIQVENQRLKSTHLAKQLMTTRTLSTEQRRTLQSVITRLTDKTDIPATELVRLQLIIVRINRETK